MVREPRIFCLMVLASSLPAVAVAQTPPSTKTPVAPKAEQMDPNRAESGRRYGRKAGEIDSQRQDGQAYPSDKLARSGGVIRRHNMLTRRSGSRPAAEIAGDPAHLASGGDDFVSEVRGTLKFAPPIARRYECGRLGGASVRPWHGRRIAHHVAG